MNPLVLEILTSVPPRVPKASGEECFFLVREAGGAHEVRSMGKGEALRPEEGVTLRIVRLQLGPHRLALSYAGLLRDSDGHSWNLAIEVCCRVTEPCRLLSGPALLRAPMSAESLGAWFADETRIALRDALGSASLEEVRGDTFPPTWWQARFAESAAPMGLTLEVLDRRWNSSAADQAAAERARAAKERRYQEDLEKERQARQARKAAKQLLPSARAGGTPAPGTCAGCGKRILTKLDLDAGGACQYAGCARSLCHNCWTIRGLRLCSVHQHPT